MDKKWEGRWTMRLFIGIPVTQQIEKALTETQNTLKPYLEKGRFTAPENFHLTLLFLGEKEPSEIPALNEKLQEEVRGFGAHTLRTGALGTFSKRNREIIWCGVDHGIDVLQQWYLQIYKAVLNEVPSQVYTPHITLARQARFVKSLEALPEDCQPEHMHLPVHTIILYESTRRGGALAYVPIKEYKLQPMGR